MNIFDKVRNIIIVNDDGYKANGINLVHKWLYSQFMKSNLNSDDVNIISIAPTGNRSGCGASITVNNDIIVTHKGTYQNNSFFNIYECSGTPVDCVHIAGNMFKELGLVPDLTISGINHGFNFADDLIYSGTFCAARESHIIGISSIALSYCGDSYHLLDLSAFDKVLSDIFELYLSHDEYRLVNVNIPDIFNYKNAIAYTSNGVREHHFAADIIPRDRTIYNMLAHNQRKYRIGPLGEHIENIESKRIQDFKAIESCLISYTLVDQREFQL